ncbi:hypothetical protein BK634_25270 [Pseudomonas chlororaphis]|nr:hypothetical protein BK634_25270 [Pseudomonas chlororaphis]
MIFVDRKSVRNPFEDAALASKAALEVARAGAEVMGASSQRRLLFTAYKHPTVKAALSALFHDKCAYCETRIVGSFADIEQFRPKASVSEARDHPGYWWLANSWENLLIACQSCNRKSLSAANKSEGQGPIGKHNRFPLIDESKRAFTPSTDLSVEQPLLLNPTFDDPISHLTFSDEGLVFSETERGNATISILGLNRPNLANERHKTAKNYRNLFERVIWAMDKDVDLSKQFLDELLEMAASEASYAGMIQQFLRRDKARLEQQINNHKLTEVIEDDAIKRNLRSLESKAPVSGPASVKRAVRTTKAYRERMASYSLADEEGIKRYKSQRRSIETISIRNIRALGSFYVDLATQGSGAGRWLMLLGENGTGKSTVLQAIALVLGGSAYISKLIKEQRIRIPELVRFRCRSGEIAVKMSGFDTPHRLKVFKDHLEFTSPSKETVCIMLDGEVRGTAWEPQTVMAGYGATRLSPRISNDSPPGGDFARVENLFDPFVPLMDAQKWLASLTRKDFNRVAIILKDLLAIDPDAYLDRSRGNIFLHASGENVSLSSLSVGYQTVVAATVDMLEILSRVWSNPLEAEGIVMIDELDAHLHPTWQMQIVNSLRQALPGVQFITTTHQPLCLRGLSEGEIVVMHRGANHEVEIITDLPSPADFRVDQLLTSPFFGLNSTTDPDVERLFDRYYALLAMDTRDEQNEVELTELTNQLERRKQFGESQREGLYLEAIDRLLARQKSLPDLAHEEIREKAVSEISAIWDNLIGDIAETGEEQI